MSVPISTLTLVRPTLSSSRKCLSSVGCEMPIALAILTWGMPAIAIASTWMCEEELDDGRLVQILRDYALEPVDAHVVFPPGRRAPLKARAFADYLSAALNPKA